MLMTHASVKHKSCFYRSSPLSWAKGKRTSGSLFAKGRTLWGAHTLPSVLQTNCPCLFSGKRVVASPSAWGWAQDFTVCLGAGSACATPAWCLPSHDCGLAVKQPWSSIPLVTRTANRTGMHAALSVTWLIFNLIHTSAVCWPLYARIMPRIIVDVPSPSFYITWRTSQEVYDYISAASLHPSR